MCSGPGAKFLCGSGSGAVVVGGTCVGEVTPLGMRAVISAQIDLLIDTLMFSEQSDQRGGPAPAEP